MHDGKESNDLESSCTNASVCSEGSVHAYVPSVQVSLSTHSLHAFHAGDTQEDRAVGVALRVSHDDAWSCHTDDHSLDRPWGGIAQAMPDEYDAWCGVCVTQGSVPRWPSPLPNGWLDGHEHNDVTEGVLEQTLEPEWLGTAEMLLSQQVMAENEQLKKEKQAYSDIITGQIAHIALLEKTITTLEKEKALVDRRKQEAEQHTRQALEQAQTLAKKNDEQNETIIELQRRISSSAIPSFLTETQNTGEGHSLSLLSTGLEVLKHGVEWMAIDALDAGSREQASASMLGVQEEQAQALRDKSNQDALCIDRMMDANQRLADAQYHASDIEAQWLCKKGLWEGQSRKPIVEAIQRVWKKR